MAASSLTQFDYAIKEIYKGGRPESTILRGCPTMDRCPKSTDFVGDPMVVPIIVGGGQGLGSVFATAQANQTNTVGYKFLYTVGEYYGFVSVGEKVMSLSRNDMGAFIRNKKTEIDEMLVGYGNDIALQFWGDGGGQVGRRGSVSGSTLTLLDKASVQNIETGMKLVVSANDGTATGHALRDSGAAITVTDVDYNAGTFDFTGSITGFADNDYLFREGAFAGNVSQTTIIKGIQAHIPSAAPTSTAFFGVDRTVNSRLAGVRVTGTASNEVVGGVDQRIENMCTFHSTRYKGKAGDVVLNPFQWQKLSRTLGQQGVRPVDVKNSTGTWNYKSLQMNVPSGTGTVNVTADRYCPVTQAYALDFAYLKLRSAEELIKPMNGDGLTMLRAATSADYELRFRTFAQLTTNKPTAHATITLAAL